VISQTVFDRYYKNYYKKHGILLQLKKVVLFLSNALEVENTEKIEIYSLLVLEGTSQLNSIERVIVQLENSFFSGIRFRKVEELTKKSELLYSEIQNIMHENITALSAFMIRIKKRRSSVKLLTKRKSLYNESSLPEYVDIKR